MWGERKKKIAIYNIIKPKVASSPTSIIVLPYWYFFTTPVGLVLYCLDESYPGSKKIRLDFSFILEIQFVIMLQSCKCGSARTLYTSDEILSEKGEFLSKLHILYQVEIPLPPNTV